MISWNFPGNQDGQVKGVADAGIENFNGTELSSLARENCQNSLDAALNDSNPDVLVEFERYFVPSKQIPGIMEYRNILKKCKDFWDRSKSEKAKLFLKDAIKEAEKENTFLLRISDYNTTGLSDPYTQSDDPFDFSFDGWNALIKIDGGANKGDDKAGAFGIGKSAPFSNSHYRLVFYRTYNQKYERAAQGISRLMSYQDGALMTSGIGYYGETKGNNPVEVIPKLDSINRRSEIGTDVFIYGFKSASDWETEITVALLESFLMSFFNEQLRVKVQGREINKKSLPGYMERVHRECPGATKGTYGNYLALTRTEGVHIYSQDFHGMGTLELRLLVDPNEKLDRKVLIVRIGRINGSFDAVAFIILKKNITGFFCTDWVDDFQDTTFNLFAGSILAYQNLSSLDVTKDYEEFTNAGSIFSVYKRITEGDCPAEINLDSTKIRIGLGTKDYDIYAMYSGKTELQSLFHSMLILPALVYVFEELRQEGGEETYHNKEWFLALEKSYAKRGITFMEEVLNPEKTSYQLAQEAMELPLSKAFDQIPIFFDTTEEDS